MANKSIDQKLADVVKKLREEIEEGGSASLPMAKDESTLTGDEPAGTSQAVYEEFEESTLTDLINELENGSSESGSGGRVLTNVTLLNSKIQNTEIKDSTLQDSAVSGGTIEGTTMTNNNFASGNEIDADYFTTEEDIKNAWNGNGGENDG